MIQQLRNSFLTWYGWADVPMSKSLGRRAEQQVAHAAADEVGDVIELAQAVENLQRVGVDVAARDRVLGARDDPRFDHRRHCTKTAASRRATTCVFRRLIDVAVCYHRAVNDRNRSRWAGCLALVGCPGRARPSRPGARSARAGAGALQPAASSTAALAAAEEASPDARARRQRRPDCGARLSRALSRERGARRPDERPRAAAPLNPERLQPDASGSSSSSVWAKRCSSTARRAPRRQSSTRCSRGRGLPLAGGARARARLVGERARPRRAAAA